MDVHGIKQLIDKLNGHSATALEAAASFASSRSHYEVLPEHLLIKLMEEGANGDLERIFHFFEVNQDAVWQLILQHLNTQPAGSKSKPVFSRRLYDWLEKTWLAANLYYDGDWITGVALVDTLIDLAALSPVLGLSELLSKIDQRFLRENQEKICKGSCERFSNAKESSANQLSSTHANHQQSQGSALADFCEDLTEKAAQGKIDPVLGRNDEIRMMVDVLCRRRKNNPILVGEPGVGKTAVVEGMAQRIIDGQVPEELKQVKLLTLDLGLLQAGAGVKGEFERRLKQVIDEVKESATPIIMFIDEAHTLIGAGGDAGMSDAANLLKPALARGELRTVAATTWSEYKQYFERDAALERRFQLVKVDEPTQQAAKLMLSGLKDKYQSHHNIQITDDAIEAAVTLSARYITGRQLPDKAIDVLDTAAARVRMSGATEPALIETEVERLAYLQRRIDNLKTEQSQGLAVDQALIIQIESEQATCIENLNEMQGLRQQQIDLLARINNVKTEHSSQDMSELLLELRSQLKAVNVDGNGLFSEVNADSVSEIIAEWTGVPVGSMVKDEVNTLITLESSLSNSVIGQDAGLQRMAQSLRVAKAGVSPTDGPLGVFLLVGPSGVGKTETARALAENLFGGEKFLTTINMSEYQEAHTVSQLKGSPPGYVGYGQGGVLTEAVRQRPYSVVLLDEVEKAHADVMNMFYQVFERGFMRDGEGREIDFRNTVILMTSNLGADTLMRHCQPEDGFEDAESLLAEAKKSVEENSLETEETPTALEDQTEQEINDEDVFIKPSITELTDIIKPDLLRYFAPALLARMQVIPFYPLDNDALSNIVALKLETVAARIVENHNMQFRVDKDVIAHLTNQCALSDSGARMVTAIIEQQILPGIARSILEFIAQDDMPDILTLSLGEDGNIDAIFADNQPVA
ncbi:type VI secretion system ATPase TssH [Flocculibacter collagenilyticus]|uniref:type VI secretion system ATPase TssH n=1 Tax=Flocculibacter collagenilyticus TaxID=2744479 RepID=UPI0018F732DB|nr:type VI secretion system ATPase TssH [Flocculibacter collagenilyticus]